MLYVYHLSPNVQQYKGIVKFKDGPLLHEEENAIMYEDVRNTGDDHWAPSSCTTPHIVDGETRLYPCYSSP